MSYEERLEQLLEEFLAQFEYDPVLDCYVVYNDEDEPVEISEELEELVMEANDLIYGQDEEDEFLSPLGYATEEGEE